jgi:imidazolonepropionase
MTRLLIKNIGRLQTPVGAAPAGGTDQGENRILGNCSVLMENGVIREIREGEIDAPDAEVLDAGGRLATPGLVDGHTHLVFGGYRQHEIPLKLQGASYLEILKAGGGILDTVRQTRGTSTADLAAKAGAFLSEMAALGVTTCEAKSGYGLDLDTELRLLEILRDLSQSQPVDLVPTYMGAHAVPPEYREDPDAYVDLVCGTVLPEVQRRGLADYVDVFCEDGAFSVEQSKKILETAKNMGFGLKIHTDEIVSMGGAQLAGALGAASAEHLIAIDAAGLEALAAGGVIAMCLPATSFYLGKGFAPVREMIRLGIPVALGSDFNPGSCPSLNLQLVMNLGYLKYRMTPAEILTAVTLNGACAIGRGGKTGTLEPGKQGDLVLWDAPDMEFLCYRFGSNLVHRVVKEGRVLGKETK